MTGGGDGQGRGATGDRSGYRIVGGIRKLVRALDVLSKRLASEAGVTSPQLLSLQHIARSSSSTATGVAKNIHVSPSTAVGILDRLEDKGLITRHRDRSDRRVVHVTATDVGRALAARTQHPVQTMFEDRAANDLSEGDFERIAEALEDIVRVLGAGEAEAKQP
jgi:DNA-binding MarR family transcriptional regulator